MEDTRRPVQSTISQLNAQSAVLVDSIKRHAPNINQVENQTHVLNVAQLVQTIRKLVLSTISLLHVKNAVLVVVITRRHVLNINLEKNVLSAEA